MLCWFKLNHLSLKSIFCEPAKVNSTRQYSRRIQWPPLWVVYTLPFRYPTPLGIPYPLPVIAYPLDTLPPPPNTLTPWRGPGTRDTLFSRRDLAPDRGTLPSVDRMTFTSENITFPQLRWRSVNILQLALTKLTQTGEDQTGMEEASIDNIANFVQYEKTRIHRTSLVVITIAYLLHHWLSLT